MIAFTYSVLKTALFVMVFGIGISTNAYTQFDVINNTDCDLYFQVSQAQAGTCNSCNLSPLTFVAANGGTASINPNLFCGIEHWEGIKYTPSLTSYFGSGGSYNPSATIICGTSANGSCGFNPITPTWITSGPTGPVLVTFN